MKRGDVVLVRFPHPSGQRGKKRPAVVVQSDAYASTVSTVVVAGSIAAPLPWRVAALVERRRMFKMNEPAAPIAIALRIPGKWSHPRELIQRLPAGCRLTGEALTLPDATQVGFGAM